jgi:asparagine synthase (glutamine-hydrolysing)
VCGFIGYLRLPTGDQENLDAQLEPMSALLAHRGPDDAGLFRSPQCSMAHRRLSIIDRSEAGRQPMSSGPITLATNSEIYNHAQLAQAHGLSDTLRSKTDTEVLLRLIETRGVSDTLSRIDGMYAFAAWDAAAHTLHLARDPFGIKPLFVLEHNHVLWFASEIKPLLLVPGFQRTPSREALYHFLSLDYIPGPFTAFAGIEEVRPGSLWSIDAQTGHIQKSRHNQTVWRTDPSISQADAAEESARLLTAAVKRQLMADVEVGVMLSGGLDSSAIAALVKRVRGDADFHTFSIGFDDPSFDESQHARTVADHLGTRHHHIAVTADDIAALLPRYLGSIHEPYADGSAMPTAMLAAAASSHVTVLLSGEGGDEVFTGYDTHAAAIARQRYRRVPRWIRRGIIAPIVQQLPVSHRKLSFDFKAKRFTHGAELDAARAHFAWREVLSEDAKEALLIPHAEYEDYSPSNTLFYESWTNCGSEDPMHAMLHTDRSFHLPDDLMVKNDRMTMAHSIEARVPFCDRELVAFLATVPTEHMMHGMKPKVLLRDAMTNLLPPSITHRKKMGLEMPYSAWMRGPLAQLTTDILSPARVEATGLFRSEAVQSLLRAHRSMDVDNGRALWGIVNCILWHELFIQTEDFRTTTAGPPVH